MAFIGKGPSGKQVNNTRYKQWVAIASQTQFTFDRGIYDPNAILVVVNNVVQEPNVDYTIAPNGGAFNVINFTTGLTVGDVVYAVDKDEGALRLNNSAALQAFNPTGYSKAFSYTGNGSADGPYVHLGFKPRWLLIKRTDSTSDWQIWDGVRSPYNETYGDLKANLSNAEAGATLGDLTATGFKIRNTSYNVSSATYIGFAIADVAGKYSLGR